MININWKCPFCNHYATITDQTIHRNITFLTIVNVEGNRGLLSEFVVCPNPDCKKFSLIIELYKSSFNAMTNKWTAEGDPIKKWQLIPSSKAQSFPDYIPEAILDDYNEACLICNLSPKASTTLSRRCIQGILRDFWKVKAGRLVYEIEQIKDKVDPLTWDAIQAVREVGNIGAHMEKDINLIVEVDPGEAHLLIGLIETLLKEWYINRHERELQLRKIKQLGKDKQKVKKAPAKKP